MELAYAIPISVALLWGAWLVSDGRATLGQVTAVTLYAVQIVDPIDRLVSWLDEVQVGATSLARILGVEQVPPDRAAGEAVPDDEHVEVHDVRFAYRGDHDVLHGMDLDLRPGERLAVVGPSGAGKSTLGRLLAGIHPPRTGRVTVGDVPLVELPLDDLRKHVVLVTQEHHVFVGTVAENLLLARPDADVRQLHSALHAVDALAWVLALPDGLSTEVGSGGRPITPAQAQQLALARLVLADPHTLVLDEATSLLDPRAARHLERSLAAVLARPHRGGDRPPAAHGARRRPGGRGRGRPDQRAGQPRRADRRPAVPTPRCGTPGARTPSSPAAWWPAGAEPARRNGGPAPQVNVIPGTAGSLAGTGVSRWYGAPSGGRGSASPLFGQNDIARSAWAVMVSDGLTPRLAETADPSTTCSPGCPNDPVVGVDHAVRRVGTDRAAAEEVRGHRGVEQLADRAARVAVDLRCEPADDVVGRRDPGRVRRAVALPAGAAPSGRTGGARRRRSSCRRSASPAR